MAMLGSPDFQVRDAATDALTERTDYHSSILRFGQGHPDPEVAYRCQTIRSRHRARIFSRFGGEDDLPELIMAWWDPKTNVYDYPLWVSQFAADNDYQYQKLTYIYLHYMLDNGATEAQMIDLVKYLYLRESQAHLYWGSPCYPL